MLAIKEKNQLLKYLFGSQFGKYMAALCVVSPVGEVVYCFLQSDSDQSTTVIMTRKKYFFLPLKE